MTFTLKSTSKHGTAYYVREGFKQAISVPVAHFPGEVAPQTIEIEASFAEKVEKVKTPGINAAIANLDPEQKKAVRKAQREAARKAATDALAAAGVSL